MAKHVKLPLLDLYKSKITPFLQITENETLSKSWCYRFPLYQIYKYTIVRLWRHLLIRLISLIIIYWTFTKTINFER